MCVCVFFFFLRCCIPSLITVGRLGQSIGLDEAPCEVSGAKIRTDLFCGTNSETFRCNLCSITCAKSEPNDWIAIFPSGTSTSILPPNQYVEEIQIGLLKRGAAQKSQCGPLAPAWCYGKKLSLYFTVSSLLGWAGLDCGSELGKAGYFVALTVILSKKYVYKEYRSCR